MKPDDFVIQIRDAVVRQNMTIYVDLFTSTPIESVTDPYWKRALALHAALSTAQRGVLYEIVRQTVVDTVSNIFGILDGSSPLGDGKEEFVLATKENPHEINGGLQGLFLELDERDRDERQR